MFNSPKKSTSTIPIILNEPD